MRINSSLFASISLEDVMVPQSHPLSKLTLMNLGRRHSLFFRYSIWFEDIDISFLDHLCVKKLYASVGWPMGAMQSLAAGRLFPGQAGNIVSISGTACNTPSSITMRFAQ